MLPTVCQKNHWVRQWLYIEFWVLEKVWQRVINKVCTLRFRNFRPPPPVRAHTLLAYTPLPPPPNISVRILFFKDITESYSTNYYQSRYHKQRSKIRKSPYKYIGKCRIKTPGGDLRSNLRFLTVRGRWELIILIISIAHFVLFLFCNKPTKINYGDLRLRLNLPLPPPYEPVRL